MHHRERKYRLQYYNDFNSTNYESYEDLPIGERLELEAIKYRYIVHPYVFDQMNKNPKTSGGKLMTTFGLTERVARDLKETFLKIYKFKTEFTKNNSA